MLFFGGYKTPLRRDPPEVEAPKDTQNVWRVAAAERHTSYLAAVPPQPPAGRGMVPNRYRIARAPFPAPVLRLLVRSVRRAAPGAGGLLTL